MKVRAALNESGVSNLMSNELNVVVYNFVDMLSHRPHLLICK